MPAPQESSEWFEDFNRKYEEARAQTRARASEPDEVDYIPRGGDLLNASLRSIDLSAVLAGDRWLSRKTGSLIIAPSGHGKSSLSIQLAVAWACGRVCFGIKPKASWRILIVQAEDDDNDVTEFSKCIERMELDEAEREAVRKNKRAGVTTNAGRRAFCPFPDIALLM